MVIAYLAAIPISTAAPYKISNFTAGRLTQSKKKAGENKRLVVNKILGVKSSFRTNLATMSAWGWGGSEPSWKGSSGPMFERRDGSLVHEWGEEQAMGAKFQARFQRNATCEMPQRWDSSK